MRNKVLFVATSDIHIKAFHLPYIKWLNEEGNIIHLAIENRGNVTFGNVEKVYNLVFPRVIFSLDHLRTYRILREIINDGDYSLVHCHTPLPSVLARLASRKARSKGTKVVYTAHGFHFYKGGPLKNWLLFYPVEYLLSAFTDAIIAINNEDFSYINGKMFHKASFYIKGIGANSNKFRTISEDERNKIRRELGISTDTFIILYIAEYIHRKNHRFIIESLPQLRESVPCVKFVFAGKGILMDQMKKLAYNLNVHDVIDFLGFRDDVNKFAAISDIGISTSKQEGLGLGLVEEMLCSVPIVATIDKGHKEIIENGINGLLFKQNDKRAFIEAIKRLYDNPDLRRQMGERAFQKAQEFTIDKSLESMKVIYRNYLG